MTHFKFWGSSHIYGMATASIVKLCAHVGHIKSLPWDDKQPPNLHGPGHVTYFKFWGLSHSYLGPGNIVLDGDPALPTERDTAAPSFFSLLCSGTVAYLTNC